VQRCCFIVINGMTILLPVYICLPNARKWNDSDGEVFDVIFYLAIDKFIVSPYISSSMSVREMRERSCTMSAHIQKHAQGWSKRKGCASVIAKKLLMG
jgi:hypothetical protein